ncbi:MAG: hypothetical protein AABZ14_00060 [Candidatus Margulisiibacteriota bacterium]
MNKTRWYGVLAGLTGLTMAADEVQQSGHIIDFSVFSLSIHDLLVKWATALGWIVVAAVGFAFGVGLSLKVFGWLSKDIDEWEEIKKGNMIVGAILISLIVMTGLIVLKIL